MVQVAREPDAFLICWLGAWAVGWVFAALTLASQFGGGETVRVIIISGDLEIANEVGPLRRTWRYRGGAIHNLSSYDPELGMVWGRQGLKCLFSFDHAGALSSSTMARKPFFWRPGSMNLKAA